MSTQEAAAISEFSNSNLEIIFSADQIAERVSALGAEITKDYKGKELVLVGVLKGSCVFLSDLMRHIDLPMDIDFMSVASYKDGTVSSGDIEILKDLTKPIRGKDVILVEDIVDTGLTLHRLIDILGTRGTNSIRVAALLDKPEPRVKKEVTVNYCGFEIPNRFVVGYGLDVAGRFRNLPFVAAVKDPDQL
ncbi:MAG TPA: hypoxanthine phosphoribosyltransferase [Aridibacter sp.]|nr:hypoxanthine phosphoribosyltransferase [Aridibacter sp.]